MDLRPSSSPRPTVYMAVGSLSSQLPSLIPEFLCMRSCWCWGRWSWYRGSRADLIFLTAWLPWPGLILPSHLPFHSITLIVLSSAEGSSELGLERLLQMVFGAMVSLASPLSQTQESELVASFSFRSRSPGPQHAPQNPRSPGRSHLPLPRIQESTFPAPSPPVRALAPPLSEPAAQGPCSLMWFF